jgi:hypothetical protein
MVEHDRWECRCRRCNGVLTAPDAVQYVWELALGSCEVPVVVGVNAHADGSVTCARIHWCGATAESGAEVVCRAPLVVAPAPGPAGRPRRVACTPENGVVVISVLDGAVASRSRRRVRQPHEPVDLLHHPAREVLAAGDVQVDPVVESHLGRLAGLVGD